MYMDLHVHVTLIHVYNNDNVHVIFYSSITTYVHGSTCTCNAYSVHVYDIQ